VARLHQLYRDHPEAGADALELNVYALATDPWESGEAIERRTLAIVRPVKEAVGVPVAVKLSPFYTSLAHFARQLDEDGVDGLVLFNRFYQPDLDVEELEVQRALRLSDASELPLRLPPMAALLRNLFPRPSRWGHPAPDPLLFPSGRDG
jgi:dihydroorotate dehydrogenase (fumarate)